jgi:cytochrome P450 family 628
MSFQWGGRLDAPLSGEGTQSPTSSFKAAAFLIGVGLHQLIFRFGEWDTQSFRILSAFTSAWLLLGLVIDRFGGQSLWTALSNAASLESFTVLGIWSSMLIYRGFFHCLHRFPGPFLARFSTLYMTAINIRERKNFRVLQALHTRYGDYVRVGPRELSVADPKAFPLIYSSTKPLQKGPWYAFGHPLYSVHTERDLKLHNERRKAWDKAFSAPGLSAPTLAATPFRRSYVSDNLQLYASTRSASPPTPPSSSPRSTKPPVSNRPPRPTAP